MLWGDLPHKADNKSLLFIRHIEYNLKNNLDKFEVQLRIYYYLYPIILNFILIFILFSILKP